MKLLKAISNWGKKISAIFTAQIDEDHIAKAKEQYMLLQLKKGF